MHNSMPEIYCVALLRGFAAGKIKDSTSAS